MSVLHLTAENFQTEVLDAKETVLIDFWAPWCGPCKMLGPIIDEIALENTGAKICKVNTEEQGELAKQYRIMSIPTLIVMKNGLQVERVVGVREKQEILDLLK